METEQRGLTQTNNYKLFAPPPEDFSGAEEIGGSDHEEPSGQDHEESSDKEYEVQEDEGTTNSTKKEEASKQEKKQRLADKLSILRDPDKVRYEKVKEFWGNLAEMTDISNIAKLTEKRKAKLKKRWTEWKERRPSDPLKVYANIVNKISDTSFLCGNNDRGWIVDFDWVIKNDTNWVKVLEGKYKDSKPKRDDNLDHQWR